ncbi:MAG: hemolysin III family protein [Isosphaeraceae bacterium]|nr:hemolysin III family protein [Isosphaeraceae bacterium]
MTLIAFRDPVSAWTHCAWLVLSIPATVMLWRRTRGDLARQISMLVFGLGLAACYAGSTMYHGVNLSPEELDFYDRLDHIGIYLLIAGSYTPLAWNMMRHPWRTTVLVAAWASALGGSAFLALRGVLPPFWATLIYLLMGWGAIFCYLELLREVTHRRLFPLLLGGMLYSVGAFLNLLSWPTLLPGFLGAHEIFHLFVMAGSAAHFMFVLHVVAPHGRAPSVGSALVRRTQETAAPAFVRSVRGTDRVVRRRHP